MKIWSKIEPHAAIVKISNNPGNFKQSRKRNLADLKNSLAHRNYVNFIAKNLCVRGGLDISWFASKSKWKFSDAFFILELAPVSSTVIHDIEVTATTKRCEYDI